MHNPSYYEAILQLRPATRRLLEFVKRRIEKRKNVFISKEIKLKTGVDLYLSDKRFAMSLGKMLKKSFKGTVKLSRKLFSKSKQTGKLIYRVTVCFRLA